MDVAATNTFALTRRRLYILPTGPGVLFALLLLALLLASINYGNGLGYALSFWLAATAVVSMLSTHRNLLGLQVRAGRAEPVFAGETARFEICLINTLPTGRYGLAVEQETQAPTTRRPWRLRRKRQIARLDVAAQQTACTTLSCPAPRRGRLRAPAFTVSSVFPLGLMYSWSRRVELDQSVIVYPTPAARGAEVLRFFRAAQAGHAAYPGDDFLGLRDYQRGDSLKHVHWKSLARGQGWYTKQFGGADAREHWIEWQAFPQLDTEARLSLLTRLVLDADAARLSYGLRLPGQEIAPANGTAHAAHCLTALALFPGAA